jgi:hypothetical protein
VLPSLGGRFLPAGGLADGAADRVPASLACCMRGLFQQPKGIQWTVAGLLAASFWVPWLGLLAWWPLWIVGLLLPVAVCHFMFALTPLLRLTGVFRYHSPMLRSFLPWRRVCDLHTGTFFDYLAHFRWEERGAVAARKMLIYFVEGLVALSEDIESGRVPAEVQIQVTSYFIREETFARYGFQTSRPDASYRLNSLISYFNLVLMYSYARGRLAFPALHLAHRATMTGAELVRRAPAMKLLVRRLRRAADAEAAQVGSASGSPPLCPTPGSSTSGGV